MNKFLHIGISIFLWFYLIRSVNHNNGIFGTFLNKLGDKLLPNGLLNISGAFILLLIFFLLYALLFYIAIWKNHSEKEE